jgi:hypothetical protein
LGSKVKVKKAKIGSCKFFHASNVIFPNLKIKQLFFFLTPTLEFNTTIFLSQTFAIYFSAKVGITSFRKANQKPHLPGFMKVFAGLQTANQH